MLPGPLFALAQTSKGSDRGLAEGGPWIWVLDPGAEARAHSQASLEGLPLSWNQAPLQGLPPGAKTDEVGWVIRGDPRAWRGVP